MEGPSTGNVQTSQLAPRTWPHHAPQLAPAGRRMTAQVASTSNKLASATPSVSKDQSTASRPKSRLVVLRAIVSISPLSGKKIPPFFDERYLMLSFDFVFIETPFRAKSLPGKPMADEFEASITVMATVLVGVARSLGRCRGKVSEFSRITHRRSADVRLDRSGCLAVPAPPVLPNGATAVHLRLSYNPAANSI